MKETIKSLGNYFFFLPFPFFLPLESPPSPSSAGDINFFRFLPNGVFSYLNYNLIPIDFDESN